jgi:hypothetical protein
MMSRDQLEEMAQNWGHSHRDYNELYRIDTREAKDIAETQVIPRATSSAAAGVDPFVHHATYNSGQFVSTSKIKANVGQSHPNLEFIVTSPNRGFPPSVSNAVEPTIGRFTELRVKNIDGVDIGDKHPFDHQAEIFIRGASNCQTDARVITFKVEYQNVGNGKWVRQNPEIIELSEWGSLDNFK